MLILGFNGGEQLIDDVDISPARHDAAAVLLRDGEIVAAVEEERFDRLKHSNCFPLHAIRYCLQEAGIELADVDAIATNSGIKSVTRWARTKAIFQPEQQLLLDPTEYLDKQFRRSFGTSISSRLQFCPHHLAHAISAFVPSGFKESLVVTLDGDGDGLSGSVMMGALTGMETLREFTARQSLGHLYTQCIALLGYGLFDEYKAMGLAPYGNPEIYAPLFKKHYCLLEEGNYYLDPLSTWIEEFETAGLLTQARRKGGSFTQFHKDFAASLQASIERIIMHVVGFYSEQTGCSNLCFAGGVAHNCTANGRLLKSNLYRNVFVQPAAHDAGGSLGAALHVHKQHCGTYPRQPQTHVYWGPQISKAEAERELRAWNAFLSVSEPANIFETAADLLAADAVIAWVQGKTEFGPRALGNRSILADPRPAHNKQRINAMIKKREGYRPFAPSVQREFLKEYFETPFGEDSFPFMNFVLQVQESKRGLLGAVTHVDGSARVQTVSRTTNEPYWTLIDEFCKRTGIPILLNTSLNNHAEPIVCSVKDSITCFLTTGIDYLVIGPYLIRKTSTSLATLLPSLFLNVAPGYQLVKWKTNLPAQHSQQNHHALQSVKSDKLRKSLLNISENTYQLLRVTSGEETILHLNQAREEQTGPDPGLLQELIHLWEERAIVLSPYPNQVSK